MRRFLSRLLCGFGSTNTVRTTRRVPRRVSLHVEGLEDRMVLSTVSRIGLPSPIKPGQVQVLIGPPAPSTPPIASLAGSTLQVNPGPGFAGLGGPIQMRLTTFAADKAHPDKLDVFDNGQQVGQFPIASINNVAVNLAFLDAVAIDDSNGLPFAAGTTVLLSGSGTGNTLNLTGSRAISGDENYTVGLTAAQASSLSLGGVTLQFTSTIGSVTDSVVTPGFLFVRTVSQGVSLNGSNGVTQTLSGLGAGGGGTLTYANKGTVWLDQNASNAVVSLNATAAAAGERGFDLFLRGANDSATIQATPSTVATYVEADANLAAVVLRANSGPVSIAGTSSTLVALGQAAPNGGSTTSGIKGNVSVSGVETLSVSDNGNVTTQEHVTVTAVGGFSTAMVISGTGLFGNDAVTLTYSCTATVMLCTGQLANTYSVFASEPYDPLGSNNLVIDDYSRAGLNVQVAVNSHSHLNMSLVNTLVPSPAAATLFFSATGGTFSNPTPNQSSGSEAVTFAGGLSSEVAYSGFTSVTLS